MYVDDHAKALLLVALKGEIGSTYNIGGNNQIQNIEVVKLYVVFDDLVPSKIDGISKYDQLIMNVEDRAGHDTRYAIDSSKILDELGWVPQETFQTGIEKPYVGILIIIIRFKANEVEKDRPNL